MGSNSNLIVTAKNGGNILDFDIFTEIWKVVDDVRTLEFMDSSGQPANYAFSCQRSDLGTCLIGGVPRYFLTRPLTQEAILDGVNQPLFADGRHLNRISPTALCDGLQHDGQLCTFLLRNAAQASICRGQSWRWAGLRARASGSRAKAREAPACTLKELRHTASHPHEASRGTQVDTLLVLERLGSTGTPGPTAFKRPWDEGRAWFLLTCSQVVCAASSKGSELLAEVVVPWWCGNLTMCVSVLSESSSAC